MMRWVIKPRNGIGFLCIVIHRLIAKNDRSRSCTQPIANEPKKPRVARGPKPRNSLCMKSSWNKVPFTVLLSGI
jgi:hypothetical protein